MDFQSQEIVHEYPIRIQWLVVGVVILPRSYFHVPNTCGGTCRNCDDDGAGAGAGAGAGSRFKKFFL